MAQPDPKRKVDDLTSDIKLKLKNVVILIRIVDYLDTILHSTLLLELWEQSENEEWKISDLTD